MSGMAGLLPFARPPGRPAPAGRGERDVVLRMAGVGVCDARGLAVRDVSFTIEDGEFVALVGPSGCGKSALLAAAAGLAAPAAGIVERFGRSEPGRHAEFGLLFQGDVLFEWKTVLDNVAAGLVFRGQQLDRARAQANVWLARLGLAGVALRHPGELSPSQRRRVHLAQVLAPSPRVLLADDPFGTIEPNARLALEAQLLRLWNERPRTILLATRDVQQAVALADRVLVMAAGPGSRIVADVAVSLPRPRDVAEVRLAPEFARTVREVGDWLRFELEKADA